MQLVSIGGLIHTLNQIDQFENMYRIHELKSTCIKNSHMSSITFRWSWKVVSGSRNLIGMVAKKSDTYTRYL